MNLKTVLSVDIGSSSLKAAIIDSRGKVLAKSRMPYLPSPSENYSAAKDWEKFFYLAADECMEKAGLLPDAVCISGNGPTLVSQDGTTLLWSHKVEQNSPSLFIPRILYFINNFTESFSSTKYLFSGPEYLIYQLTGKALTILPEERYLTAYWTEEKLREAGLSSRDIQKLPPYQAPGTQAGTMLLKGKSVAVYTGAPDFVSALIGTAAVSPLKLCDRSGSSEGLNLCTENPLSDPELRTLPSAVKPLWNLSYLIPQSGAPFEKYKKSLEEHEGKNLSYSELIELCLHQKEAIYLEGRALMIEIARNVKKGLDILRKVLNAQNLQLPDKMIVTGGQAKNLEWLQLKSSICGMELLVPECTDAELTGDAVFAFTGMGLFTSFAQGAEELCRIQRSIKPQDCPF